MAEDVITVEHLGLRPKGTEVPVESDVNGGTPPGGGWDDRSLREIVRGNTVHVERLAIVLALRRAGGNKAKAARLLQVDYKTLYSKVKGYGIQIDGD
jgi:two-component system nitrogen regulation response regulator GlnG